MRLPVSTTADTTQALEGKDIKDMLTNVGAGGAPAAAPVAGGAVPAEAAPAAEAKEEKKKEESAFHVPFPGRCRMLTFCCRGGGVGRGHGLRSLRLNAFFPLPLPFILFFRFLVFFFLLCTRYPRTKSPKIAEKKKEFTAGRSGGRWALCACWHHGEGSKKKTKKCVCDWTCGETVPRWDVFLSLSVFLAC